jgi:hypothetical protein
MYSPNNIRFRIVSSSAIAQFRQDQAFDFNELINNHEYSFSPESREILLLNYDMWFRFILRLEKVLIRNHHTTDELGSFVEHIEMFARETIVEIGDIMSSHPDLFGTGTPVANVITKSSAVFSDHILRTILACNHESMYTVFPRIVTAISNSLNNLLFILHETENLKLGNAFLSYTDEVKEISAAEEKCILTDRAKLYQSLNACEGFILKNYTSAEVDADCSTSLVENGIKILDVTPVSQ